ncbi:MAG: flagellin [Alphaproteobacteria bacterium]|nr:flagellin [Alphaproteobacteria bacterium]
MVGRVSTYNVHQSLLRDTARTQTTLFDIQGQLSSGLKSSNFAGLGGKVEQFADLESRLSRGQAYLDGTNVLSGRLDIVDSALGAIIETATDLRNLISLRRNASVGDSLAFQTQLTGKWQELVSQINVNSEGRYLFSGAATNLPAVDGDNLPVLQVDGTPDLGYYRGSSDDLTLRIDDNVNITYNVRADDPAFQKIFAGIATANKFSTQAGESQELQDAYDLISEGIDGLIGIRAEVNANKVTVISTTDRLQSQQLYWKGLKEEIGNADIVSLSTEVAINQGILQASFQAFARISNLKLSDFLR